MTDQHYVSNELTHFVGSGLKQKEGNYEREQYNLLRTILEQKCLKAGEKAACDELGWLFSELHTKTFSSNEKYEGEWISFADIPVGQCEKHMSNFSHFGLAFEKQFVASRGANPVFYVLKSSKFDNLTRKQLFDDQVEAELAILRVFMSHLAWNNGEGFSLHSTTCPPWDLTPEEAGSLRRFLTTIDRSVFAFAKFFELGPDDAKDNYYMEREWRLVGCLKFELSDVCRIILPREYENEFSSDFPCFISKITAAEDA